MNEKYRLEFLVTDENATGGKAYWSRVMTPRLTTEAEAFAQLDLCQKYDPAQSYRLIKIIEHVIGTSGKKEIT